MMRHFKHLLLILFLAFNAYAFDPGVDELGFAQYVDTTIKYHPQGFGIGLFTTTFGDAKPGFSRFIQKRQDIPFVKFNLSWKDDHKFNRNDFSRIVNEAKRFSEFFSGKNLNIKCYFNGATEHNLSASDAQDLANRVLSVIPQRCIYVNNPLTGSLLKTSDRIINEIHGTSVAPSGEYGFSFDGTSSVDSDVTNYKNKHSRALYFLVWHPANNGRLKADDPTPRPQRKAWPTRELLEALGALFRDEGVVNLNKGFLYKSLADRHTTPPEPRAYKPVIIAPQKASEVVVGDMRCSYYGTFIGGGYRYYCPKHGYGASRNPVDIKINNKKVGKVNPAFRCCTFRKG